MKTILNILMVAFILGGCATKRNQAPSTSAITGDIQAGRGSIQEVQEGANTVDYKDRRALEYF